MFTLTDDDRAIRDTARDFATEYLAPSAVEWDQEKHFPVDVLRKAAALFDRYWKMVSSVEQDKEANTDYFSYQHSQLGEIKYISSSTVSITSFGELFLVQYLPLDGNTSQIFEQLAQTAGQDVMTFAPWPLKTFPHSP